MTFDPDWKERTEYEPLSREYLLSRKKCCSSGCRNCPYPKVDLGKEKVTMFNEEEMADLDAQHQAFEDEYKPKETTVVNLHKEAYDVYIGRAGKSQDGYFGNPHTMGMVYCSHCQGHHDRNTSIEAYKKDFLSRIQRDAIFRARVEQLRGKRLGCFCKPLACHGDVIKEWLDKNPNP